MNKKLLIGLFLVAVLSGCGGTPMSNTIKIDSVSLLFFNNLNEEVLVKSKNGEIGFFGVFIQPQKQYLWEWNKNSNINNSRDTISFQTTFEFFKEGQAHDFTQYISSYTFEVDVYDSVQYADTCFIN